jgi:hypothetical protein
MTTLIGVNTSATFTSDELNQGKSFGLLDRHADHAGATWVFVKASAAFTLGDAVVIRDNGRASPITLTNAKSATSRRVGFAQVAVAADSHGWVQETGAVTSIRVALDCEPRVSLYPTSSAGVLDDATASVMIQGVVIATSATAAGAYAGNAAFPAISRGANLNQI